ncbi:MAG: hypothetical protein WC438_01645 [Candidatus Pacearchaeota archaeon]
MINLENLQPTSETLNLIPVPTFITGTLEEAFSPIYEPARRGNDNFKFRGKDRGTLIGSNFLNTGLANWVFAQSGGKFRIAVPTDNSYETIYPMIKGNFYTDFNASDVWEAKPSYEKNNEIWKQIIELAEKTQGKVKFPFRMQGVYCIPDNSKKSYGARIEPAKNFRIIEDDRLSLPTGTRFNSLDENGIIIPDKNGQFTKYTLGNGLSRVCLYSYGNLSSDDADLANSGGYGRVAVVGAEGAGKKI